MADLPPYFADRIAVGDCWQWTAHLDSRGYAPVRYGSRSGWAHRMVYEILVGPIPDGLELDHLCRNRGCVNPQHLEPVTHQENVRRSVKPECRQGHLQTVETSYIDKAGRRHCRVCHREQERDRRARLRLAVAA